MPVSSRFRIANGHVIDPANGIDAHPRDIWIEDGRIVAEPGGAATRTLDAHGLVVMPGGVDIHSHLVGSKVNAGRYSRPETRRDLESELKAPFPNGRSGSFGGVPSTFAAGYKYSGLGYTTAFDAAIAPAGARQAHLEFGDTPVIDKGFLVLAGNHHYALDQIKSGENERLKTFLSWLLGATRAYGLKIVNPGGIEKWKQGRGNVTSLDDTVDGFDITPRRILMEMAQAADELALPHSVHIHCNNLGLPGNWETSLETMKALDGFRSHLTHIQFHSYGGSADQPSGMNSQVGPLVDYFNSHPQLTVDVGQVMFGDATAMTADGAVGEFLHRLSGRKWISHDIGLETGCGIVPIEYKDKNLVHAVQWAIGLEWMLRAEDPWRIALSTDHPNGGSFLAYPRIMALLMDRGLRADTLKTLPEDVRSRTLLGDLNREYTLSEIAILTRAAPARILGLANKGHLGPGADGDVAIYSPDPDKIRMFSLPRYVIKAGEIVLDDGEMRPCRLGRSLATTPEIDPGGIRHIEDWLNRSGTVRSANYAIRDEEIAP